MKIYLSVDIEGICGTTNWDEVTRGKEQYHEFQVQMTAEVSAACMGAFEAGATEIYIKDAHDTAGNLIAAQLPKNTILIRGWSRHPYMMMQELDTSFDTAMMIGYHSFAGNNGNPLSHTMSTKVFSVTINGIKGSEFLINWYTAMYERVPVSFVSGDQELCDHAKEIIPKIHSVSVKQGSGDSTINIHPETACTRIKDNVYKSLSEDTSVYLKQLPEKFTIAISYFHHQDAYKYSFFPGAIQTSSREVSFESDSYFEVLKFFLFAL